MLNAWIIGLLGIWMVIAPFAGLGSYGNAWNNWIVGVVAAVLGFSMAANRTWERPLSGVVGLWLFISGFIPALTVGGGMLANDIIMGVLLIVAGFAATRSHALTVPPHVAP